jgi:phage FluMu protein gp41
MTDRVRGACRKLSRCGWFTRQDALDAVAPCGDEVRGFGQAWQDLVDRKELTRAMGIDNGRHYRYNILAAPKCNIAAKIYRAMHVRGAFSAADIRRLTDADISYIGQTIRKLAAEGWLELTGKRGRVKIYRVRDDMKFYLEFVQKETGH